VSSVLADALLTSSDLVAAAAVAGYSVRVRDAVGGGQGGACLRNLRHTYLVLTPEPAAAAATDGSGFDRRRSSSGSASLASASASAPSPSQHEVVIDPSFCQQFLMAHPSPRYQAVLDVLPPVLVSTLGALQPLVEALCGEMAAAFAAADLLLPPWRSYRSMLSKWLPRRSLDLVLQPGSASSTGQYTHHAAHAQQGGRRSSSGSCRTNAADDAHAGGGASAAPPAGGPWPTGVHVSHAQDGEHHPVPSAHAGKLLQALAGMQRQGSGTSAGSAHSTGTQHTGAGAAGPAPMLGVAHALPVQATGVGGGAPAPGMMARARVACHEPLQRVVGGWDNA
jgi:uncharacterized protein (TIGR01615 family)